jgi:hypothetical protein
LQDRTCAIGAVGESCMGGMDCATGNCTSDVCQPGYGGQTCVSDTDCFSDICLGTVCDDGGLGTTCRNGADCVTSVCTSNACAPGYGAVGCHDDEDCRSGTCGSDDECELGGTDAPCTSNAHCLSESCTGNTCDLGGPGKACNSDDECSTYLCGSDGLCAACTTAAAQATVAIPIERNCFIVTGVVTGWTTYSGDGRTVTVNGEQVDYDELPLPAGPPYTFVWGRAIPAPPNFPNGIDYMAWQYW